MRNMKLECHKRREVVFDHTRTGIKEYALEVLKKFKSSEVEFLILVANGSKNVQMLDESLEMLNDFARIDYVKTGKDKRGPFLRLKIIREEFFFVKY